MKFTTALLFLASSASLALGDGNLYLRSEPVGNLMGRDPTLSGNGNPPPGGVWPCLCNYLGNCADMCARAGWGKFNKMCSKPADKCCSSDGKTCVSFPMRKAGRRKRTMLTGLVCSFAVLRRLRTVLPIAMLSEENGIHWVTV